MVLFAQQSRSPKKYEDHYVKYDEQWYQEVFYLEKQWNMNHSFVLTFDIIYI